MKVPILLPFDLCGHDRIVAIDSPDLDTVIQMQLADIPSDCMGKKREIWAHFHKMAAIHWQFDGFANEEQMEINGKKRTDDDKVAFHYDAQDFFCLAD